MMASSSALGRLLLWTERMLVIAGTAMLTWGAVLVADALVAQRTARSAFEAALMAKSVAAPSALKGATVVAPAPLPRAVETGSPIASLSIPRIHLSAMVLQGSDTQTLRRGPGHIENTALPGEPGNMVIAGHRDSFFWSLQDVHLGDDIFLDTTEGPLQYRVTSARVVTPRDVSVLTPTDEPVLTLITCFPFSVLGPAPDRFVVRAVQVGGSSAAPVEAHAQTPRESAVTAALNTVAANDSIAVGRVSDDQGLVQEAVRSYLRIQGARLVTCAITFSDDRAVADCTSVAAASSEQEPQGRIFTLARAEHGWSIRSIALK
jgi:sortase A